MPGLILKSNAWAVAHLPEDKFGIFVIFITNFQSAAVTGTQEQFLTEIKTMHVGDNFNTSIQ